VTTGNAGWLHATHKKNTDIYIYIYILYVTVGISLKFRQERQMTVGLDYLLFAYLIKLGTKTSWIF